MASKKRQAADVAAEQTGQDMALSVLTALLQKQSFRPSVLQLTSYKSCLAQFKLRHRHQEGERSLAGQNKALAQEVASHRVDLFDINDFLSNELKVHSLSVPYVLLDQQS